MELTELLPHVACGLNINWDEATLCRSQRRVLIHTPRDSLGSFGTAGKYAV